MKVTIDHFQLLDYIQTKEGCILAIGLKNNEHFITPKSAFKAYKEGKVIAKTIEIDGEPVFIDIADVCNAH
ncbi:hypothetical protein ACQKNX_23080 [Lysinibacillus sp. NPDC093712]|uniref:hypothetical protein n=1 Tax=Lysinibacillus sp. NPDC093712 TaxID=3390579 RepID=UPI003D050394